MAVHRPTIMPLNLLALPHEILHCIFIETDTLDTARLCCCHTLNNYIRNNRQLFKGSYLNHFVCENCLVMTVLFLNSENVLGRALIGSRSGLCLGKRIAETGAVCEDS